MLESRPSLEVVGLWFNSDNETDTDSEAELRLRRPLALHRQSRKPPLPPSSDIPQSSSGTNSLPSDNVPRLRPAWPVDLVIEDGKKVKE